MSKRNFPDFLDAYFEYSRDDFCPDPFHYWTGVSTVAAALERKVWLPWSKTLNYYPNIYTLLVSLPGMGKSSAANVGVALLRDATEVRFIPEQITEAKFIESMGRRKTFVFGDKEIQHSSAFYYASEASSSLKNVYGDFIAMLTDFYDCRDIWEKATMKSGEVRLKNICVNVLAGCTFDYLGKLITDDNIMGGFASRILYVIHDEKKVRNPGWNDTIKHDEKLHKKLVEDLHVIHNLKGRFRADEGFKKRYMEWFPKFDEARQGIESEKMQSLLVRKSTNLMKLCMIVSASRRNDLLLKEEDWVTAMRRLDKIEAQLPKMLRAAQMKDTQSQRSLNLAILSCLDDSPTKKLKENVLKGKLLAQGFDPTKVIGTIQFMCASGTQIKQIVIDGKPGYELLVDPNEHL